MFDEFQRLRENPHLLLLLEHYAQRGTEDRATWRERLMQMEGMEPKQISGLHGELIVFDWIEQNTGQALSACYRITVSGLREYRHIQGIEIPLEFPGLPGKKRPSFPRKKEKSDSPEAAAVAASEESLVPAS